MNSYLLIYILVHIFINSIISITDDWSFLFEKSFQKENIILKGNKYTCKIDIDSNGIIYVYCNDVHIGSSKSSRMNNLLHDCYPDIHRNDVIYLLFMMVIIVVIVIILLKFIYNVHQIHLKV